ncbi:MAG: hypothetical protein V1773_02085 [bacterium]
MSDDTTVKEIISAFAIGCLEKENYENFAAYFQSGKSTELAELGNLQNVVSLLPTSLNPEMVNPQLIDQLKEKISSLYDNLSEEELGFIKENAKLKKQEEAKISATEVVQKVLPIEMDEPNPKIVEDEIIADKPIEEKVYKPLFDETNKPTPETHSVKTNSGLISPMSGKYLLFITAASLIIAIFTFIFSIVALNSSDKKITELEQKIEIIEIQNHNSQIFITNYQKFLEFINQGNITTISLSDTNGFIASKLYLSLENNRALLQILNLAKINSNEVYQIWSVGKKGVIPLVSFTQKNNPKFIEFEKFPSLSVSDFDLIKVTVEKKDGIKTEGNKALYYGGIAK